MNYEELPKSMQEDAIRPYWELLQKKRVSLFFKRLLDMIAFCDVGYPFSFSVAFGACC